VPRVIFFLSWGAKTATVAKLKGRFCSFYLGGQNRNFEKVKGLKLLLSLSLKWKVKVKINGVCMNNVYRG